MAKKKNQVVMVVVLLVIKTNKNNDPQLQRKHKQSTQTEQFCSTPMVHSFQLHGTLNVDILSHGHRRLSFFVFFFYCLETFTFKDVRPNQDCKSKPWDAFYCWHIDRQLLENGVRSSQSSTSCLCRHILDAFTGLFGEPALSSEDVTDVPSECSSPCVHVVTKCLLSP